MFVESYYQVATHIFEQYQLQMPLHLFLKEYFKNNRKYGSRDRKYISELVFGIYRLGKKNEHLSVRDRLTFGSFLSHRLPILFFEKVNSDLAKKYEFPFDEKKKFLELEHQCDFGVPFELSETLSEHDFIRNLYSHPRVFIRIRKNREGIEVVLRKQNIDYEVLNESCFSFESTIKLNEILAAEDYVIQDYASQQVGNYFQPKSKEMWWDCCCASGGKSIQLLDKNSRVELIVSDVRESIIKNLHQRFQTYGYSNSYLSFVADATEDCSGFLKQKMNAIICDAPCSGSGTWARSPEQFYFFNEEKIAEFHKLQVDILTNILHYVKPKGKVYYITCSVFKHENENVLAEVLKDFNFVINQQQVEVGSQYNADSMFISEIESI